MTLLAAAGALSMLAQVVVLRELVAALYGVELLYVLALGCWLAGTAIGAAAGRGGSATPRLVIGGCLALGLLAPAEVIVLRAGGPVAGAVSGAYLPFPQQAAWIAAATLPPAVVAGWLFPALAGLAARVYRTSAGRSYAVESAGAAAGGIGVTLAMGMGASTFQIALVAPALGTAAAILSAPCWPRRRRLALAVLVTAALIGVAAAARPWDLLLLRRMYPSLVDAADTPYGRVAVVRREAQGVVFENGALAFDTEGVNAEAFADLAAIQHPRPERALVIGGGGEGVADALARHAIPLVHDVEVDERAYALVRAHTGVAVDGATAPRRVTVFFEEPRRFLQRAEPYDLIVVAAGEPLAAASSRFYTAEFFAQCAERLTRGGVVAIRLAAAENVWPGPLVRRTASIIAAVRQAFRAVEIVPGATLYVFASNGGLSADPAVLAGRLLDRGLRPRLITAPYLTYLYTNDRRDDVARLFPASSDVAPNRDAAPVCYQYAAMLWLSTFYPGLAASSTAVRRFPAWLWWGAAAAVAAMAPWVRRRHNRRVAASIFAVGFIGMVLETLLLLRFQIRNGVVYQQVGWLLTCFMAGMSAAGYAAGGRRRPGAPASWVSGALAIPVPALASSLAALAAIAWLPATAGLAGTSVLLAAAGASVGWAFSAGAGLWEGHARGAASALYAADVAGGAAGAVLATLVLVPAAGLDRSAAAMLLFAAGLLLIIPRSGSAGR